MRIGAVGCLVLGLGLVLNRGIRAGAQWSAAGDSALSLSVSGRVIILDEGKASTSLHTAVVVPVGSASSTQQFELDVTLPVLGVPLRGQASMEMDTRASSVLMVPSIRATGQAEQVVLRGPAGDVTVSLKVDQPVHGFGRTIRPRPRCISAERGAPACSKASRSPGPFVVSSDPRGNSTSATSLQTRPGRRSSVASRATPPSPARNGWTFWTKPTRRRAGCPGALPGGR